MSYMKIPIFVGVSGNMNLYDVSVELIEAKLEEELKYIVKKFGKNTEIYVLNGFAPGCDYISSKICKKLKLKLVGVLPYSLEKYMLSHKDVSILNSQVEMSDYIVNIEEYTDSQSMHLRKKYSGVGEFLNYNSDIVIFLNNKKNGQGSIGGTLEVYRNRISGLINQDDSHNFKCCLRNHVLINLGNPINVSRKYDYDYEFKVMRWIHKWNTKLVECKLQNKEYNFIKTQKNIVELILLFFLFIGSVPLVSSFLLNFRETKIIYIIYFTFVCQILLYKFCIRDFMFRKYFFFRTIREKMRLYNLLLYLNCKENFSNFTTSLYRKKNLRTHKVIRNIQLQDFLLCRDTTINIKGVRDHFLSQIDYFRDCISKQKKKHRVVKLINLYSWIIICIGSYISWASIYGTLIISIVGFLYSIILLSSVKLDYFSNDSIMRNYEVMLDINSNANYMTKTNQDERTIIEQSKKAVFNALLENDRWYDEMSSKTLDV